MCERKEKGPEASRILEDFRKEKDEMFLLTERIRASTESAESAFAAIREEAEAIDRKEAFFEETRQDLANERRQREAAEKALAAERKKSRELETENRALLADKQTLLKTMLERR